MPTKKPSTRRRRRAKEVKVIELNPELLLVAVIVSAEVLDQIETMDSTVFYSMMQGGQHSCFLGTDEDTLLNLVRSRINEWTHKMAINGRSDPEYRILIGPLVGRVDDRIVTKIVPLTLAKGD